MQGPHRGVKRVVAALGAVLGSSWLLLPVYLALASTILYRSPESAMALSFSDSVEYATGADRIVRDGRYEVTLAGEPHPPRYLPGFSLFFVAPVYAAGGGIGEAVLPVLACALGSLALVFAFCRRALPGPRGAVAAAVMLLLLVQVHWFYELSREIMSDVPALLLGLVALALFLRAARRPDAAGWPLFLLAGLVCALSASMKLTGFSLALPFAALLVARRPPRPAEIAALGAPVALAAVALLAYNHVTFGHPLYTGYHYWLPPESYRLAPRHVVPSLIELVNPFLRPTHAREKGDALVGLVLLVGVAITGVLCWRLRPDAFARTRPALRFFSWACLPLLAFHAFYPFYSARFALLPNVIGLTLGVVWAMALLDRVPTAIWLGVAVLAVGTAFGRRPPAPDGRDWYKPAFVAGAAQALPQDACLVTMLNPIYIDLVLLRDSDRCFIPLNERTTFVGWLVGAHGETRAPLFEWSAAESPERVEDLLRRGRPVYVELMDPYWSGQLDSLQAFLEHFEAEPVWRTKHNDGLARLRLPAPAG